MSRLWRGPYRRAAGLHRTRSLSRRVFDWFLAIAILGLLILLAARLDRAEIRLASGSATVNDGDTITLGGERIRLRGIDAPEYSQICRKAGSDYACGRASRDALARLAGRGSVTCKGRQHDRYGRLLADCTAAGVDLNGAQVEAGWAIAYGDFESEQERARKRGAGLWAGSFDEPRVWRDAHGGMVESDRDHAGSILDWIKRILRFPEASSYSSGARIPGDMKR
jgi:endonuclease YncB( thermonuclease family)